MLLAVEDRRIQDIQTFQEASRGVLGSLRLVILLRARYVLVPSYTLLNISSYIAWFGALSIVLSFAFEPFLQQLVALPTKHVPSRNQDAILTYTSHWDPNNDVNQGTYFSCFITGRESHH